MVNSILCPHSESPTSQSCNIIHNSQPIVHLPPNSFPAAAPELPQVLLNIFHFSFSTQVLPKVVGVLVPGVVTEWIEGVVALRGTVLHIQLRVKGLDTMAMSSLRGVMVSATVNSSWWGFLLYCMKNELMVTQVRVRAE